MHRCLIVVDFEASFDLLDNLVDGSAKKYEETYFLRKISHIFLVCGLF